MKKIIVSIVSAGLFKFVFFPIEHFLEPDLILISVLIFILWKGNFMVDHYLNNKYSWVKNPHKRLRIQVIVSFLFTSVFLFIFMYTLHQIRFGDGRIVNPRMIQLFPISLRLISACSKLINDEATFALIISFSFFVLNLIKALM